MNHDKLIKVCNMAAFIFALSFGIKLVRDLIVYHTTLNSAPFWVWIAAAAVQYLMPAACLFLVGQFLKAARDRKSQETDTDEIR